MPLFGIMMRTVGRGVMLGQASGGAGQPRGVDAAAVRRGGGGGVAWGNRGVRNRQHGAGGSEQRAGSRVAGVILSTAIGLGLETVGGDILEGES